MVLVGYHASHEQVPPSGLLASVVAADAAGWDAAMCSDHLSPWGPSQGESGNPWPWLGAALQATSFGLGVVTAPVQRYHPVVTAQAIATLGELFPGRFWAALGSGENLNEHVTGDPWPDRATQDARLAEAATVIRRLLAGEEVDHDGLVRVHRARLWTLPERVPAVLAAAISPTTSGTFSLAAEDDLRDLADPLEFECRTAATPVEDIRRSVLVSADLAELAARIRAVVDLGFDRVYLHHVGPLRYQRPFVDAFAEVVLPALR